jgi:hypothetical protein
VIPERIVRRVVGDAVGPAAGVLSNQQAPQATEVVEQATARRQLCLQALELPRDEPERVQAPLDPSGLGLLLIPLHVDPRVANGVEQQAHVLVRGLDVVERGLAGFPRGAPPLGAWARGLGVGAHCAVTV